MLTTRFEEIRIRNDENFDVFYVSLNDIVNSRINLSRRIQDSKIEKFLDLYLSDLGLKSRR